MSASTARPTRILLVELDDAIRAALLAVVGSWAVVEPHDGFESARARLSSSTFDLLVTNLRLGEYNGLHLVILVRDAAVKTSAIVYADERDLRLASDVQRAGAFFELAHRLPISLPGYVGSALPSRDRRDPLKFDRRKSPRGGRRAWDEHLRDLVGSI